MKLLYIQNGVNGSGGFEKSFVLFKVIFSKKQRLRSSFVGLNNGTENLFYNFDKKLNFTRFQ